MPTLLNSRRFWLLILDCVISIALMAVGVGWPAYLETAKLIVQLLQPVFIALIAALTVDDTVQAILQAKAR